MPDTPRKIYSFGGFKLDPAKRKLWCDERDVHLPSKAFDLLVVLAENSNELMPREQLVELIWPNQFVEESNLSVTVSALRKSLGEQKGNEKFILTVPRQGYRFIADVTCNIESAEPTVIKNGHHPFRSDDGPRSDRSNTRKGALLIGAALFLLIAAAGFGYWKYADRIESGPRFATGPISIRRLTSHGKVVRAALSPEGKYFAYVSEDPEGRSLWLGQTADGSSLQLRSPSEIVFGSIVFAPNGNSIYCVGTNREKPHSVLYRMSVLGPRTETVLEKIDSPPAFSPDGSRFAFVRHSPQRDGSALLVANADGTNETVLAQRAWRSRFAGSGLSWSPDGSVIAAVALEDDDFGTERVMLGVNASNGNVTPLTKQKWEGIYRIAWLNDGSGLLTVATDKSAFEWLQLWQISYPAGEGTRLTRDLVSYNQNSLSLSADNSTALAVQLQQSNNIWLAPADDREQARQVTFGSPGRLDGAYGIDWTPDLKIVYSAVIGDGISIWRLDPNTGETQQLTPAGYVERRQSITGDGRYIVFESNRSGDTEIWRTDLSGDRPVQLTWGGNNRNPHVSPDGGWVAYASTNGGVTTIRRIGIDGGIPVDLTGEDSHWPRISPDGKSFACIVRSQPEGPWSLAVFDVDSRERINLFPLPESANYQNGFRWTPDGTAITYRDWREGIWQQRLDGGIPQRLTGLPKEKLYPYAWSPDGKWFAFTRGTESYDVVLITGLNGER